VQQPYRYQLVVMGPNASLFSRLHEAPFFDGFEELGLAPSEYLQVVPGDRKADIVGKGAVVGLWYGGPPGFPGEADHLETLAALQRLGAKIFPLVEDLTLFGRQIPAALQSINGIPWSDARVVGDVLRAFGLTRRQRQAFLSYKRSDSEGIARQLAHTLFDRGYQVFLDTASVERGMPFQNVLHDRLADIDLVVLLDSPNALQSRWVHEELDLINQLGLGVLQLLWTRPDPEDATQLDLRATKGTEFSVRFPLEPSHFVDPGVTIGTKALLRDEILGRVADRAESTRIRSLGARQARVLSYLRAEVHRKGLNFAIEPAGPARILKDEEAIATLYPIVGLPDALAIEEFEQKVAGAGDRRSAMRPGDFGPYRIVYDGLGILDERLRHLTWLNSQLFLKTLRTELLNDWLAELS
jgi:TIR domain